MAKKAGTPAKIEKPAAVKKPAGGTKTGGGKAAGKEEQEGMLGPPFEVELPNHVRPADAAEAAERLGGERFGCRPEMPACEDLLTGEQLWLDAVVKEAIARANERN